MGNGDLEKRLVAAGVELLAEAGTDAVTLREIARRAGVSHGAPRRYFPTHQALLAAIAREGYRELGTLMAETVGRPAPPRDTLMSLARRYVAFAAEMPGMFALMFRHDLLRGNNIGLRSSSTPLFAVLVRLLEKAGVAQPSTQAAALWAELHGLAQLWNWGTLNVVTGLDSPEPLIAAAVDAHLGA